MLKEIEIHKTYRTGGNEPILFHSNCSVTDFEPGRVDSPPISINLAPDLIKLVAC